MTAEGLVLRETARAAPWIDYMRYTLDLAYCKAMVRSAPQFIYLSRNSSDQTIPTLEYYNSSS